MVKNLFFLLVGIGLSGCARQEEDIPAMEPGPKQTTRATIPVEEALEELDAVLGAIASETRAAGSFTPGKAIREIRVSGGTEATRNEGCELPDTMVYVVNFADNQGFAVLGARRSLEPVYAVTESGSFDADKLNAAIAQAQARRLRTEEDAETRTENNAAPVPDIGTDYAYVLLADAMVAAPRIAPDTLSTTYGPWQTHTAIGPLVEVKWDQTYPFNMAMPEAIFSYNASRGRYKVGREVIAAAQLMTTVRRPNMTPGHKGNYNWTTLKSVSNYTNLSSFTTSYTPENVSQSVRTSVEQLADVLSYLSVQFKASYEGSNTIVNTANVISALKKLDPAYYANARTVPFTSNENAIYASLRNNKPVYISGTSLFGPSVWVVDGYLDRSRIVTYELRMGYTGSIYTEQRVESGTLLHFNWGQQGNCDGYYALANLGQRVTKDEIIDALTPDESNNPTYGSSHSLFLY